jgi:26S proteasome regulatory subunit N9
MSFGCLRVLLPTLCVWCGRYAKEKVAFDAQPALCYRLDFVKEKLSLLALMNFVFETPADERTIPFARVAEHCRVPVDQVEWMAMRAMSLGLIKGAMDEIDQTLQVDWVQPRVLDGAQMGHLAGRLGEWAAKVDETGKFIEGQTLELGI